MKTSFNLYVVCYGEGKFSLPFPAINDHFAMMACSEVPEYKGLTLFRVGSYDSSKGKITGRARAHEVK